MISYGNSACACRQHAKIVYPNTIAERYTINTIKGRALRYLKVFACR